MTRLPGLRRPRFLDPWRRPLAPRLPWHVVLAASIAGALTIATLSLGEDLASAPLLAGIRETLYRLALPRATRHLDLRLGTLGDQYLSGCEIRCPPLPHLRI